VAGGRDARTGLPVHSLYGKNKGPTPEMLDGIDILVYDIPDVGVRYYTFPATLLHTMRSCAAAGVQVLILDRPNPLGGEKVEGNILDPAYESLVGFHPICVRYALTIGELGMMMNEELALGCPVQVLPCEGWERPLRFPETGGIWVPPSPAMPRFETALVYGATCLIEGTNLSEGRGTALPFEQIGAPWVEPYRLAEALNGKRLPGVWFSPVWFNPSASKHKDRPCAGVRLYVTDSGAFSPAEAGAHLIFTLKELFGDSFAFLPASQMPEPAVLMEPAVPVEPLGTGAVRFSIDRLAGGNHFTREGANLEAVLDLFRRDSAAFAAKKRAWHLY
jgi:uncharacterized protein YbbC (DUF1343 family)